MQIPQSVLLVTSFILLLGISLQPVGASIADPVGVVPVATSGTWPKIPFTIPINGTISHWIHFSYGGRVGTLQQTSAFTTIGKNLSINFAKSNSTVGVLNSSVGDGVQSIYIVFQLTPRTLKMKTYSTAIDMVSAYVKKWGVKEIDFEVGNGYETSAPEGIFQVRLSREPPSEDTNGTSLPSFFNTIIPSPIPSNTISAAQSRKISSQVRSLPTVHSNSSSPSIPNHGLGTSTPIGTNKAAISASRTIVNASLIHSHSQPPNSGGQNHIGTNKVATSTPVTVVNTSLIFSIAPLSHSNALNTNASAKLVTTNTGTIANASVIRSYAPGSSHGMPTPSETSRVATSKPVTIGTSLVPSNTQLFNGSTIARLLFCTGTLCNTLSTTMPLNSALSNNSTINWFLSGAGKLGNTLSTFVTSNNALSDSGTIKGLVSGTGISGTTLSTKLSSVNDSLAHGANTLSSTFASGPLSTIPGGKASITSTPVAALNSLGGSGTSNAASTTGSVGSGGLVPHRDGQAGLAAGGAAGGGGLGMAGAFALGAKNQGLVGAGIAGGGGAVAEAAADNGFDDNSDSSHEEDDIENDKQSLSLGGQSQSSGILVIQSTIQSQGPSQTSEQTASTIATPQPSRTSATSSFFITAAPTQNSSLPIQSMAITSCLACTQCPGFQVNVLIPSNSTSEDEDYDGADDGDPDADSNLPKRAAGRRYHHQKRETPLVRNFVGSDKSKCTVTPYTRKPAYPGPGLVVKYEPGANPANQSPDMAPFYQVAQYWAVPSDVPQGSCEAPSWKKRNTADILNKDPAINQNPWVIGGESPYSVNIDHVYETQLVNMFFYARMTQDPQAPYAITCDNITKVFDEVDDSTHPEFGTRINVLYSKLASFQNPEFLGIGQALNTRKGRIFAYEYKNDAPMLFPRKGFNVEMIRTQFAQLALTLDIINNATIWSLFETTNSRIYQEFQRVDQLIQYRADNNCADKFLDTKGQPLAATWADSYSSWMTDRIIAYNTGLQRVANRAVNAIPTDDSPRFKVPLQSKEAIAAVWSPWLASFTSAWPVSQMTLPAVTEWPTASPAKFGPNDCAAPQTILPSLAPTKPTAVTNEGLVSSTVPVITFPVTNPEAPPSTVSPIVAVATLSASSSATTSAASANGDPCGPLVQDNPNYPNTCDAKPDPAQSPSAYGVLCSSENPSNYESTGYIHGETQINWDSCMASAKQICADVSNPSNPTGYWIWSYQQKGCAVGIYLPGLPGSAPPPTPGRCETLIFQAMVDSCSATSTSNSMASVNLVDNLSYLPSDISSGSQVNAGYPSYVISPTIPGWLGDPAAPWPNSDSVRSAWQEGRPQVYTGASDINYRDLGRSKGADRRRVNRFKHRKSWYSVK